ncbi:MAG: amidohydrolase, partial [Gammaproteobacteria bacterium]|nr:amidohydrolase [Gammaproteobacteria bacterium]
MKTLKLAAVVSSLALMSACGSSSDKQVKADAVYQNGYVYTVDASKSVAQAVAVKGGEIVYVGSNDGVQ